MPQLDSTLATLRSHPGVEHVLVLGRDGLLIQHAGGELDAETVSAMIPAVASSGLELGRAAGMGAASTIVVKLERGVALVAVLSDEVLLAVLVRDGVGFAPLLRELSTRRDELAAAV